MSSTASSASASAAAASTTDAPSFSGGSSSLYVYTFLIAIVVLGAISAALVVRAYIVRRRFRRRMREAILRGEPLPELQVWRPFRKEEKSVGPRPAMWEAEMRREKGWGGGGGTEAGEEEEAEDGRAEGEAGDWEGIMPVSLTRAAPPPAPPAPAALPLPEPTRLRDIIFTLRAPREYAPPPPPAVAESEPTTFAVPDTGTDVVLGVVIALPGPPDDERKWFPAHADEAELPEVVLGVMSCRVDGRVD